MPAKEIIRDESAQQALLHGIDTVANAVKLTLGPKGRNVILEKKWGAPVITNDGATIAKEISLPKAFENMGAQLIKEAAAKTNDIAGDGTTTATILAQVIVQEGIKNVAAGADPMAIKRGIDKSVAAVVAELSKNSNSIEGRDQMAQVASVPPITKRSATCWPKCWTGSAPKASSPSKRAKASSPRRNMLTA